jgi:hypothetical protein
MRLLVLVCLVACATPYQSAGLRGGYSERPIGPGRWIITAKGNGFTSRSTMTEHTYRRAAELCPQGFHPLDSDRDTDDDNKSEATLVVQCDAPQPTVRACPSC